jgi:hypothetical protein
MEYIVIIKFKPIKAASENDAKMKWTSFLRSKGVVPREEAKGFEGYEEMEVLVVND